MKVSFLNVGMNSKSWDAEIDELTYENLYAQVKKHGSIMSSDVEFAHEPETGEGVIIVGQVRAVGQFKTEPALVKAEPQCGGLSELLEYIKNDRGLKEPLMFNFGEFSEERIKLQLEPFWFPHVTASSNLTPLENAKKWYMDLNIIPIDNSSVNELIQFCYDGDKPQAPQFGVAQNGGLAIRFPHDVVWFKEPDGTECWARMS